MSDGTQQAATTLEALAWLSLKARAGALEISTTENGDVGIFEPGVYFALGDGDTFEEAAIEAHRRYHAMRGGPEKCQCRTLEEQGDALND